MNPELRKIVDDVKEFARNPSDEYSPRVELQVAITESGKAFSEDDMLEAAREVGVPEDELIDWLQDHASWLGGPGMITEGKPKKNPNPDEDDEPDPDEIEEEEESSDDDYCDCEDGCEEHEQCPQCKMCVGCCCDCEREEEEE